MTIAFSFICNNTFAQQDLSKLSEKDRNNKLIQIASSVYKAPVLKNLYRDFGTPTIAKYKTISLTAAERKKIEDNPNDIWKGSKDNQPYYVVMYHYDFNKEILDENYAAKVYIWENTGVPFGIQLSNSLILAVRNGKVPNHNSTPPAEKVYKMNYGIMTGDIHRTNYSTLPKTAKYGEIITIKLLTTVMVAWDGWTTEQGFNFDSNNLSNGEIISDKTEYFTNTSYWRIIKLRVLGDMSVTPSSYQEEYEDFY